MKYIFNTNDNPREFCDKIYLIVKDLVLNNKDFEVVIQDVEKLKTPKQHKGYWRLCSLLVPEVSKHYKELNDKEAVSDLIKHGVNYTIKTKKHIISKSLRLATLEDMNNLIEEAYRLCEFFGLKDYELTSQESASMVEFFNNKYKEV